MKNKKIAKFLCLFILTAILLSSCISSDPGTAIDNSKETAVSEDTTGEVLYTYPDADYGGYDFRILNTSDIWDMIVNIDCESESGELVQDAIYRRNRKVEENLNIRLKEVRIDFLSLAGTAQKTVQAGEDAYDIMYLSDKDINKLATGGNLYNLLTIPELELDQVWWDSIVKEAATLQNRLYMISGDLHLMVFEGTWVLFFNENLMENLTLDFPYQTVSDGNWTMDQMVSYMKAAVRDVNGDSSYNYDGSDIFGLVSFENAVPGMIYSGGEMYFKKNENGSPVFALNNTRFYSVFEKMATLFDTSNGMFLSINVDDKKHSVPYFMQGNALFLAQNLAVSSRLREMEDEYGILPYPKYDESQTDYYSSPCYMSLYMTIPVTDTDTERAAVTVNALSYESYSSVIPKYYEINLTQKNLRNEASVEMLDIIRESRIVDLNAVYSWCDSLSNKLKTMALDGNTDAASAIAAAESGINAAIEKTMLQYSDLAE